MALFSFYLLHFPGLVAFHCLNVPQWMFLLYCGMQDQLGAAKNLLDMFSVITALEMESLLIGIMYPQLN